MTALGSPPEGTGKDASRWAAASFSIQRLGRSISMRPIPRSRREAGSRWSPTMHVIAHPSGLSGSCGAVPGRGGELPSRTDFGLSGKVTRIVPDTDENLDVFRNRIRESLVLAPVRAARGRRDAARLSALRRHPCARPSRAGHRRRAARSPLGGKRARVRLRKGRPDATMQLTEGGSVASRGGELAAPAGRAGGKSPAPSGLSLSPRISASAWRRGERVQLRLAPARPGRARGAADPARRRDRARSRRGRTTRRCRRSPLSPISPTVGRDPGPRPHDASRSPPRSPIATTARPRA